MRFIAVLLLLLTASPPTDVLARDAETRWVSFDLTPGNQIRFTMLVNDRPVTAMLDTGATYSVLSRAFVDAAGWTVRKGGRMQAIGGSLPVGWFDARSVVVGGLTRTGGSLAVAALARQASNTSRAIDLLVGRDLTAGYALDLDYAQRRFRLLPSGRMPFTGVTAPLSISPDNPVYLGELTVNGHRLGRMIVDTGDGNIITLSQEAWAGVSVVPRARTSAISYGLGGAIVTDLFILDSVRSGDLTIYDAEIRVEAPGGYSQSLGMSGRIGSGLLQNYRVLLDPAAGRMVFAPNAQGHAPPVRSTSGLLVAPEGDRLRVLHVMRGSPAERDGWRAEETICVIDGTPVPSDYAGSTLAGWSIGETGRSVAFDMCDGSKRTLRLRHFY